MIVACYLQRDMCWLVQAMRYVQGRVARSLRPQYARGPGIISRTNTGGGGKVVMGMTTTATTEKSDGAAAAVPAKSGMYAGGVEMPFTSQLSIVDPANIPV